jgi:hypothetical protein
MTNEEDPTPPPLPKLRHSVRTHAARYDRACKKLREALRDFLRAQIAYHEALGPSADQKRLTRLRAHLALTYRHPSGKAVAFTSGNSLQAP